MTRKQLKISGEEDRSILYFRLEHCTDGNNINGISLVVEDKENNLEATLLMINEIVQSSASSYIETEIKIIELDTNNIDYIIQCQRVCYKVWKIEN